MLDNVTVDAYGAQMPLNQVAQVHAPEAQLITVQPFDPSQLGAIEKAIRSGDLGLNPMNDGKMIRVPVPAAHAGTAAGYGEAPPQDSRRTSDRDPQYSPRRK